MRIKFVLILCQGTERHGTGVPRQNHVKAVGTGCQPLYEF